MRSLLLAGFLALATTTHAVAQSDWPTITVQHYGLARDDGRLAADFGQLMSLTVGQDATSAYLSFRGAPANQTVFVMVAAKRAYAELPWGDLILVDHVAVILPLTPEAIDGSADAKARFDRRVLATPLPVQFYLQAFTADLTGRFPALTSNGVDVTASAAKK